MSVLFYSLKVQSIEALTAEAMQISFEIPHDLKAHFRFQSGQFITLKAEIAGQSCRRSYSICSTPEQLEKHGTLSIGIKRVPSGVFSTWATEQLHVGDSLEVMPPDGRFVMRDLGAKKRLGIAAGSGITPIISIAAVALSTCENNQFTLIYGNQKLHSIMFSEALQDLKDRYPDRLQLIHILSRQATELPIAHGSIDAAKLTELGQCLIDFSKMDEAFVCGPEQLIETVEAHLPTLGLPKARIHSERFASEVNLNAIKKEAFPADSTGENAKNTSKNHRLDLVLDGKTHVLALSAQEKLLDVALDAGLDLPYACKGGVCCTCRAKVLQGEVAMEKNFTLEDWEVKKGFVLSCQARCLTEKVVLSFDER